jgi:glutamate N-acetyltransferase/amino-acid N-acetyltransferase
MKIIDGGITAAKGYKVGSVHSGVKKKNLDLTLLVSETEATFSATFTTNIVKAAPVIWDEKIFATQEKVKALVINSGNANACTGLQGERDTQLMAQQVAKKIQSEDNKVLVCSTGVIGQTLPMEKIITGISSCFNDLNSGKEAANKAANAILTTDTFTKEIAVEIELNGKTIVIGGMAKGSGMIHPNMATMLSFITTDANISKVLLTKLLKESVEESYNMISVDGDTSTNDTVIVFANGSSGSDEIVENSEEMEKFFEALKYVNRELAKKIVSDGEGATKFIELTVLGAPTVEDARLMARSAVSSNLVKTAFFGSDANWGRLLCAMGYSKANFDPTGITVTYTSVAGLIVVLQDGEPLEFDEKLAKKILKEKVINVRIVVGDEEGEATAWGCDLSYDYVKINGDYRT